MNEWIMILSLLLYTIAHDDDWQANSKLEAPAYSSLDSSVYMYEMYDAWLHVQIYDVQHSY